MILYNVTINMESAIHDEWLNWTKTSYLPELMKTGIFSSCKLCRLVDSPNEGITYSIQYFCDSMQNYQRFQKEQSERFRDMHAEKFNKSSVSFETLMEVIEEYTVSNFSLN
ncbi:MAG TPA: DUF4286 family protein [Anseongella sp.]